MIDPTVIAAAQASQRKWKIPASVTIAQYGDESGWGTHEPPGSNNGFGIKALPGQPYVMAMTSEWNGEKYIREPQPFRKFATVADAFDAHAQLLATSHYYIVARAKLPDANAFANALTGVYATSPTYGADLIKLMQADNLYQYDVAAQPVLVPTPQTPSGVPPVPGPVVSPLPAGPSSGGSVVDFSPDAITLPSQVTTQLQQAGTHMAMGLIGVLGTAGVTLLPSDEAKIAALGGSLAVAVATIAINAALSWYRHQMAVKAVATAKAA